MNTPELPMTDAHIEVALDNVSEITDTNKDNLPTVSEVKEVLTELQHHTHRSEWNNTIDSINSNHVNIEHLSKDALIVGTSYETFSVSLEELGHTNDEDPNNIMVRIIQQVHNVTAEDVFDITTGPDIYTFITTLPERHQG